MTQQSTTRRRDNSFAESCGYVTFLLSNAFFVVYFLWALLPSHIVDHIDEHYTTYRPPAELAGYLPAYLALLFVFVPVSYMGLNMVTCSEADGIDGIWDTRSNAYAAAPSPSRRGDPRGGTADANERDDNGDAGDRIGSVPAICDEDARLVNLRIRRRLHERTVGR